MYRNFYILYHLLSQQLFQCTCLCWNQFSKWCCVRVYNRSTALRFLSVGFMVGRGHVGQVFILHKNFCPPPPFFMHKNIWKYMNATYALKSRTTTNTSMRIWLYSNIFDTLCAVFTAFAAQIPCKVHPKHRPLQWSMLVVRKNDKDTPILYLHLKLVNIFQNQKIQKSKNTKI
jgi:hypothetical protein